MNEVIILEDFLYCIWIYDAYGLSLWDSVTKMAYPSVGHAVLYNGHKQKIIIKYEE